MVVGQTARYKKEVSFHSLHYMKKINVLSSLLPLQILEQKLLEKKAESKESKESL